MIVAPITLSGQVVWLKPLSLAHYQDLCAVGLEEDLWRWIPSQVRSREDMRKYINEALDWQSQGIALPFATVLQEGARAIGGPRYAAVDKLNRRLEIG